MLSSEKTLKTVGSSTRRIQIKKTGKMFFYDIQNIFCEEQFSGNEK